MTNPNTDKHQDPMYDPDLPHVLEALRKRLGEHGMSIDANAVMNANMALTRMKLLEAHIEKSEANHD